MPDDPTPFRDAEAWLAEQGIERERITVPTDTARTEVSPREAARLATETAPPPVPEATPGGDAPDARPQRLDEEVTRAVAYVRRATASTPTAEPRLRRKLADRDVSEPAIDLALARCRDERIVDDPAFAAALVDEARRKGHAPRRIRADLERREFPAEVIATALAAGTPTDLEADAFAVARDRADRLRGLEPEAAFRRLVGQLARRGYPESLARKAARQVIYAEREARDHAD